MYYSPYNDIPTDLVGIDKRLELLKLNPQRFKKGDVVYFVRKRNNGNHDYYVDFGLVEENYPSQIVVSLLHYYDQRGIDGIPLKECKLPTRWQKLPKKWDCDADLFKRTTHFLNGDMLSYEDREEYRKHISYDIKNPDSIKEALKKGILIYATDYDFCRIETEIDEQKGWRIIRKYPMYTYNPTYLTFEWDKVYPTYEEAQYEVELYEKEIERQKSMTYKEWAIEQINLTIDNWKSFCHLDDETVDKYRDYFLNLDNVEDVELRRYSGRIQWKYWNKKKWADVEL